MKKTLKEIKRHGTGSLYLGPVKNANTKSVTYNSFGKVVKESINKKTVPVYHAPDKLGEYELVGHVHKSATSIGAAKLAKKKSARYEKVDGKYGWVAEDHVLDKVTHSPEEIAKKHNVTVEQIESQLKQGIKIEQEHTSHLDLAREIALDHLWEKPDYYTKLKKVEESFKKDDLVTVHYGAHAHEPHRLTIQHPDGEVTILPTKPRGRANRYPQGELKVPQKHLHAFKYELHELHDEPERLGAGMRGISGTEGMNVTEEPRKTLKLSKAEWDHHTRHSTAQYDHEGKPWIVKKDPSGAAVRIPVTITEDYPHRDTIRKVLKEALPQPTPPQEKPESKTAKTVKGVAKKEKEGGDANTKLTFGKTKDKFEPDPVLTPVLSIANMPGGSVR